MSVHGLTEEQLGCDLLAETAGRQLRMLVRELIGRARVLARKGRECLPLLEGADSVDRSFVLELIVRLYQAVLCKIVSCDHDTMSYSHRLTSGEKNDIGVSIADDWRFALT
jgi:phytoene/squalene synthetase